MDRRTIRPPIALALAGALGGVLLWGAAAAGQTPAERPPATAPAAGAPTEPGSDVAVNDRGTVELHVQGADLRRVLQLLSTQGKTNIIATKDVQGTVTADLYGVTFTEALEAVLRSAGFRYVRSGNFINVMTQKQYEEWEASQRDMAVKVFKLNYLLAADAKIMIAPAMSEKGQVSVTPAAAVGISGSKDTTGGNALAGEDVLVIRDYPENLEKVSAIIKELDARPPQVLIEATILRATLTEDNALGIDFNVLAGIDFQGVNSTGTGAGVTTGAFPVDDRVGSVRTDFAGGVPNGGISIGFISNNIAAFVRALETVTDVAVVANPKLLVMNKQRGEVLVGDRDGYITTTFTETTASQTVEFLETGTKLVVRPFVYSDGNVRMEIHPEDSDGSVDAQGLPSEETTECTTNVLVRDGRTIVIGGLFRERTSNSRAQVPYFGNIPVLGNLFRRKVENTTREEVIILITPHIVRTPSDEVTGEQLKDDITRMRIGLRQGLLPWGRDRLSQSHMRWARQHVTDGNMDKALWDVNLALSLQPRMEEALRLKERLTKQAIWAQEANESNVNIIMQRLIMQELGEPVEKVAVPYKPRDTSVLSPPIRESLGIGDRPELPLMGPEWEEPAQKPKLAVTTQPASKEK